VLSLIAGRETLEALGVDPLAEPRERQVVPYPRDDVDRPQGAEADRVRHGVRRSGNLEAQQARRVHAGALARAPRVGARAVAGRTLIFDLETQRSAEEVGGWGHIDRMGLALAVVYDRDREAYRTYYEADVDRLLLDLVMAERVVGFNVDRFDLRVLSAYTDQDLSRVRTLDLLAEIHAKLGFRLSLGHLCEVNLGESKAGDGLQSLRWWKDGRIDLIEQYCKKDVDLTRRLFDLGSRQGYLLYRDHADREVRVPVDW
jgi:DEAD/DEAH box helicase domain-containing protein